MFKIVQVKNLVFYARTFGKRSIMWCRGWWMASSYWARLRKRRCVGWCGGWRRFQGSKSWPMRSWITIFTFCSKCLNRKAGWNVSKARRERKGSLSIFHWYIPKLSRVRKPWPIPRSSFIDVFAWFFNVASLSNRCSLNLVRVVELLRKQILLKSSKDQN